MSAPTQAAGRDPTPLQTRLDERLAARIRARLRAFDVRPLGDHPGQRRAAVALTLTVEGRGAGLPGLPQTAAWSERPALVLTLRSHRLRQHAGQWALPGGRIDADETPEQAALRELAEEVGLHLNACAVLGRLDDFATRSGYVITPVVVWGGPAPTLSANESEVASIHRIPVAELLRADAPLLEMIEQSSRPVLRMPIGDGWIAAPTAAFLYQFREVCVHGRSTRVAHFEQPTFAWK